MAVVQNFVLQHIFSCTLSMDMSAGQSKDRPTYTHSYTYKLSFMLHHASLNLYSDCWLVIFDSPRGPCKI